VTILLVERDGGRRPSFVGWNGGSRLLVRDGVSRVRFEESFHRGPSLPSSDCSEDPDRRAGRRRRRARARSAGLDPCAPGRLAVLVCLISLAHHRWGRLSHAALGAGGPREPPMCLLAALFEKRRPPGGGLESREETPKKGIRNASVLRRNNVLLHRTKSKASFAEKSSRLTIARRVVTPPPWRPGSTRRKPSWRPPGRVRPG
jgi:hypothetical protein